MSIDRTLRGQRRVRRRFMAVHVLRAGALTAAACALSVVAGVVSRSDGENAVEGVIALGAVCLLLLGAAGGHLRTAFEAHERVLRGPYPPLSSRDTARFEKARVWFLALSEDDRRALRAAYDRAWTRAMDRAILRIAYVLDVAGRYRVGDEHDPVWLGIDQLHVVGGGAPEIALAVLGRDVIHPDDYELIVGWARSRPDVLIPGETLVGAYGDVIRH